MKLKNRPHKYLKRSDLRERSGLVKKPAGTALSRQISRDFSEVEIDSNFYFIWHQNSRQKNR